MRRLTACAAIPAMLSLGAVPAKAAEDPKVAAEVIGLARAQWAAEIAKQPAAAQLASASDDYTEFNPDYPTRLDGKDLAVRMAAVPPDVATVVADMQNSRVQVYGETAVLTYNYTGLTRGNDGKVKPASGKSTRVYVRQSGRWMLVHAHFSPATAAAQP
jgi:ketosteroid isomerase-like protein